MTFLLAPGEYEATFGDVEFPDGTHLDVVGNVDNRPSGSIAKTLLLLDIC